jgi:hypothetical protein
MPMRPCPAVGGFTAITHRSLRHASGVRLRFHGDTSRLTRRLARKRRSWELRGGLRHCYTIMGGAPREGP